MSRMGRSLNAAPVFASQAIDDASELEPLVGTYVAFGVESEAEARKALELLRLDPDDRQAIGRMLQFRRGLAYFRDFEGRCVPLQIDPGEELLRALDTTPGRRAAERPDPDAVAAP
jgi:hypothetical protein